MRRFGNLRAHRDEEELEPLFTVHTEPGNDSMMLRVLKLNGTSFNVLVLETGTVGDLYAAIEQTMNSLQEKMLGYSDICWDLVWGNFSLSYRNQKLLNDKTNLRSLGIRHNDQLEFVRHVGRRSTVKKRRSLRLGRCFPQVMV